MTQSKQAMEMRLSQLLGYLKQDPSNAALLADVFDTSLAVGNFTEAGFQVARALHADPTDVAWLRREALLLLAQGHFAKAADALSRLIEDGEDDSITRFNLAYARFGQGQWLIAKGISEPLREQTTEVGDLAWSLWLRCEHRLLEFDEGLSAFRMALAIRKLPPEVWGVASLMAFDAGSLVDAQAWAERALQSDPDQMEAIVVSGSIALGKQQVKKASELFERALGINVSDGRTWSGLAFTRMLNFDFPGAQAAFNKAIATMADHIGTWIGLGWCEFLSKRPQAAQKAFEQAIALDRNFGESHGALAVALVQLGQLEDARHEIDIALKLDPRGLSARYAQSMLSGEVTNPEAFQKMTRRVLAQYPSPFEGEGEGERTLADIVLKYPRK